MGFLKTVGGFVRDVVAPIGLAFIPTIGPYLAAAYSGINTGIILVPGTWYLYRTKEGGRGGWCGVDL